MGHIRENGEAVKKQRGTVKIIRPSTGRSGWVFLSSQLSSTEGDVEEEAESCFQALPAEAPGACACHLLNVSEDGCARSRCYVMMCKDFWILTD